MLDGFSNIGSVKPMATVVLLSFGVRYWVFAHMFANESAEDRLVAQR